MSNDFLRCAVCQKEAGTPAIHRIEMRDPLWEIKPFWACDNCANNEEEMKKYLARNATLTKEKK